MSLLPDLPVRTFAVVQQNRHMENVRADLNKVPQQVQAMFDAVASRYDLMNDLLSFGQTRYWRKETVRALSPEPGQLVLDLAAGTGTSAAAIEAAGAKTIACDLSLGMLQEGRRRYPEIQFVAGDATALPFQDSSFDAVTISFGIRNVQNPDLALAEMLRVTKPGGKLVICEFSTPENALFRRLYQKYLIRAVPMVASRFSSNAVAYKYLADSILDWPNQPALASWLQRCGWEKVAWRSLTGGIVAIHRGTKI